MREDTRNYTRNCQHRGTGNADVGRRLVMSSSEVRRVADYHRRPRGAKVAMDVKHRLKLDPASSGSREFVSQE